MCRQFQTPLIEGTTNFKQRQFYVPQASSKNCYLSFLPLLIGFFSGTFICIGFSKHLVKASWISESKTFLLEPMRGLQLEKSTLRFILMFLFQRVNSNTLVRFLVSRFNKHYLNRPAFLEVNFIQLLSDLF